MDNSKEMLEATVRDTLERGDGKKEDPTAAAVKLLLPRYEARVRTEKDPIVEETTQYRTMADEVDDRYDKYMNAALGDTEGAGGTDEGAK